MLAPKHGEGEGFLAKQDPNSSYPADGILFEGLGVPAKSGHPRTGSGSMEATPRAPIKVGVASGPLNPP